MAAPDDDRACGAWRSAAAGIAAALAWAAVEPLDRRLLRFPYSDVALLGKLVTRGPGWRAAGLVLHAANGASFGLVLRAVSRRSGVAAARLAAPLVALEHVMTWQLTPLVDRFHPARGSADLPPLHGDRRAFAQATLRHAVFALVLRRLVGRDRPRRPGPDVPGPFEP